MRAWDADNIFPRLLIDTLQSSRASLQANIREALRQITGAGRIELEITGQGFPAVLVFGDVKTAIGHYATEAEAVVPSSAVSELRARLDGDSVSAGILTSRFAIQRRRD